MLEVCAGWACLDSVLSSILSLFFLLSLGDNPIETENCPKEPFNPKTNQPIVLWLSDRLIWHLLLELNSTLTSFGHVSLSIMIKAILLYLLNL